MKKLFAVVLAAALCLTICGCANVFSGLKQSAEEALESASPASSAAPDANETDSASSPAEAAAPTSDAAKTAAAASSSNAAAADAAAAPTESPAPLTPAKESDSASADTGATAQSAENTGVQAVAQTESAQAATETVTPAIDTAAYAYNQVKVTKSPTSEVVYEGGRASFVAYAQNSTGITWLMVAPGTGQIFDAASLAKSLPGLSISGIGTNTLTIGCIPQSLDGWRVQAKFYGEGGPVHSSMASISVWQYPSSANAGDSSWNPWSQTNNWNPWAQTSCNWSQTNCDWNPWTQTSCNWSQTNCDWSVSNQANCGWNPFNQPCVTPWW